MNGRRPTVLRYGIITALAVAFAISVPCATAGNANPRILPPSGTAFGKSYGAWSAAWWQYVLSQPASSNPLSDPTGAGCRTGQSGPVFFLVGGSNTATGTRDQCVVPGGKALFFPLINAFDVHTPGDGLDLPDAIWNDLEVTIGFSATELHASIDGVPVSNLDPSSTPYRACAGPVARCTAPVFDVTLPDDNLFGLPAGVYAPAASDGFYLMLAPLSPGPHTITFGGSGVFGGPFSQDITYRLVVSSS